ncbi:flagellar motor protein [Acidobacteria bacterium AB60]|nr:flagellar motor protein [Acidobacteria bacterium AB60]
MQPVNEHRTWDWTEEIGVDKSTFAGVAIALGGVVVGLLLEGGRFAQVLQPTAALIVLAGTAGAVLTQFPLEVVLQALKQVRDTLLKRKAEAEPVFDNLMRYAYKARRDGILSLDVELAKIEDPFLKDSLMLAIDGVGANELRKMMELQLEYRAEKDEQIPRVFEAAAGFAPTFGILGAVVGLIQIMQRLQDIGEVGKGIAVAFVATVYGVGSANIFFLPWAGRLRLRLRERQVVREMMLQAVLAILEGVNPRTLETQLVCLRSGRPRKIPRKVAAR